jgi:hypothetical protein
MVAATARYTAELVTDPLRPQVWAGLAITLPYMYPEDDLAVLQEHTDVVAHLCRVLSITASAHIVDLAGRLASAARR